jgi:hypothetical protein
MNTTYATFGGEGRSKAVSRFACRRTPGRKRGNGDVFMCATQLFLFEAGRKLNTNLRRTTRAK